MNPLSPYLAYIKMALALLLLVGAFWLGHHLGAQSGQIKLANATTKAARNDAHAADLATKASEAARVVENHQAVDFAAISSTFMETTSHAYPSLADALPTAVAAGSVQLRDSCPPTPPTGSLSAATARSRAADAAATQALADRVQNSIAAVQAGDDADARERQLDAQIVGLQAILKAERQPP